MMSTCRCHVESLHWHVPVQVLLCTDLWKDEQVLHSAYHDSQGVTEAFIKNGMVHALRTLGVPSPSSLVQKWRYEVRVNKELQQVT